MGLRGVATVTVTAGVSAAAARAVAAGWVRPRQAAAAAGVLGVAAVGYLCLLKVALERLHKSVGFAPPTDAQLAEEDASAHPLFRHVPALATTLAWRRLGDWPTAVHEGTCNVAVGAGSSGANGGGGGASKKTVHFYVKREDLSSELYGGNKVRTLEHQLAIVEAKAAAAGKPPRELMVIGSGGSNQVVATVVHGLHRRGLAVTPAWLADPPDLDNTLNMLSTLSFPVARWFTWGSPLSLLRVVFGAALFGGDDGPIPLPVGGNNPVGVLGQVGGALELAEQIDRGEVPDVDGIYVAVGSSCTVSGLIIGVALARQRGLKAFRKPGFRVHACPIHHAFAAGHRICGLMTASWSAFIPITPMHSIRRTCAALAELGGPDLTEDAVAVLVNETVVHADADVVGEYGVHSEVTRRFAKLFDETGTVTPLGGGDTAPGLWLCGHFCAKAFYFMATDLAKPENAGKTMLFWQTKSRVQPLGDEDEWERVRAMPAAVHKWANKGKAESDVRPGRVDTDRGSADDYRGLMTHVGPTP